MKVKDIKNGIKQAKSLLRHWERNRQSNYILMYEKPLKDLIEIAQRQVPKKPIKKSDDLYLDDYSCPNCKIKILPCCLLLDFCEECGQALRWPK